MRRDFSVKKKLIILCSNTDTVCKLKRFHWGQYVAKKPHQMDECQKIVNFLYLREGYRSTSIEIHAALAIHCRLTCQLVSQKFKD